MPAVLANILTATSWDTEPEPPSSAINPSNIPDPQTLYEIKNGSLNIKIGVHLLNRNKYPCEVKLLSHVWLIQVYGLYPTRLLHPWDFPGKNTRVGCHFLLQGIFPTQGSDPGLHTAGRLSAIWVTKEAQITIHTSTKPLLSFIKSSHLFLFIFVVII